MRQPTTTAAKIKIGQFVDLDATVTLDGEGIAEVTHTQTLPYDRRVLVVFDGGFVNRWEPEQVLALATDEQIAKHKAEIQRQEAVSAIYRFANWLAEHPELPPPTSVTISAQHSIYGNVSDEEKLAIVGRAAAALGSNVKVSEPGEPMQTVRVRHAVDHSSDQVRREFDYVVHAFLDKAPELAAPVDDLADASGPEGLDYSREVDNGDPAAPLPAGVEGHAHQRNGGWRDEPAAEGASV